MKTNVSKRINPARTLFQLAAKSLRTPVSHGHPELPAVGRFQIDFDGYKGITDLIGGDLFPASNPDGAPIESDLSEIALKLPAIDPNGGTVTTGELLDDAIDAHLDHRHPDWNDEEGAYGTLGIRFVPRLRITGKITRRYLSSRTSRV